MAAQTVISSRAHIRGLQAVSARLPVKFQYFLMEPILFCRGTWDTCNQQVRRHLEEWEFFNLKNCAKSALSQITVFWFYSALQSLFRPQFLTDLHGVYFNGSTRTWDRYSWEYNYLLGPQISGKLPQLDFLAESPIAVTYRKFGDLINNYTPNYYISVSSPCWAIKKDPM